MKKIYEQYIKIPENEKISNSVFKSRITLSVIAILSCITVMLSTAFAFFYSNLTQNFTMRAAEWDICVEVNGTSVPREYFCQPTADEMYEVKLSSCGTATEGYCIIKITKDDETDEYYTQAFSEKIIINIQAVAGCKLEFIPKWGNPDKVDCKNGETICHSSTPPPEVTAVEDGESFSAGASGDTNTEESADTSSEIAFDETSSNEPEASSGETETTGSNTEFSDSDEASDENTVDSSEEGSSPSDTSDNSESEGSSESTSAPAQSSEDSSSSSSDSSSSSSGDSASGDSSASESSSSGGGESSSESSETSSVDGGSGE